MTDLYTIRRPQVAGLTYEFECPNDHPEEEQDFYILHNENYYADQGTVKQTLFYCGRCTTVWSKNNGDFIRLIPENKVETILKSQGKTIKTRPTAKSVINRRLRAYRRKRQAAK